MAERADRLVRLFFGDGGDLGVFTTPAASEVPTVWRELLDHRSHMTVTLERRCGGRLGLKVLREVRGKEGGRDDYAREILLVGPSGKVVQYGIVRIDLASVPPPVRSRIEAGAEPLGRVLIDAGTLRDIHDVGLVSVVPGHQLREKAALQRGSRLFGRVAQIAVSASAGDPLPRRSVVELLEIPIL